MKDKENKFKRLQFELQFNKEDSPSNRINNVCIMVHKTKVKNRKKIDLVKYGQHPAVAFRLPRSGGNKTQKLLTKHISMTEINKRTYLSKQSTKSSEAINKKSHLNSKFIINRVSEYHFNDYLSPFHFPTQKKWKVYRCQLRTPQDSCCCCCNSDAMFEVMKSLYDCYKKKNCDNCNCILCSHILQEERRLGEERKSLASLGAKEKKKRAEKMLEGKTPAEKEEILKEFVKTGQPLPKGKTASEKALLKKLKAELGVPESKTTTMLEKIKKAKAFEVTTPSERMKKAKAAGLLTPIEGKPPEQQEKILRGLAMQGLPVPEGKTASEKKLIEKVRKELALPPEPKTASMKDKYAKAADAGLMQPLEGKSPKEKEIILQGLHDKGIPLPEARTVSEKALIAKVKAGVRAPSVTPSERLRKAKAAGLLTPIEGKPPEQQEKILRGLAMQGLPLPEGKTASEKKLIKKVRKELALPPKPKTASMKVKYAKAADAGLMQPLEGKSPKEKERILQGLHDKGILLPEGRTASEKALIAKVKAGVRAPSVTPSERFRKAKAAGLLTPIEGKPPEQQEKILRGLAMQGLPLPEGKTASEKKLIEKVRKELALPPEPKTASMKDKYAKAADAGLMQPLEDKSTREKEIILQGLHDRDIPLPEGRTASEKVIIAKVKAGVRAPSVTPSERQRKAKSAGLLTPIEGKPPEQQEKILKGLAMQGLPLPEGKTASEKKLIEKIRKKLALPPEPKTASMKEKYAKAADAGFMQPLEGKSPKEKERILQGLHDREIALPEGRTASEEALVARVKAGVRAPSEKRRRARAAGLLTPLERKTPSQKVKIMKGLAMVGLPIPEAKTASEKQIMEKVRIDLGLSPEPKTASMTQKYAEAADAGLMQPLEGKSPKEKERILQGLHERGIPLPEGRTLSEEALIARVKAGARAPSEKLRRARAAGLLTPLERKTPSQKVKIMKGLAMEGLPLPEAKTASEKQIMEKVRTDLGLPPEPKTASMKKKYAEAADAGLMQPLDGKSPKEKERILQGLHDRGIPLPEGQTRSEEALIDRVKVGVRAPSEKLRKAKAAGLLTPLEGKTDSQKERIMKGLAMEGLPLPEAKTASEKKIMEKVRADLGLPPEPKTTSMRHKYAKAADAGLLQPLEGKSPKEKERILQGLRDRGIPLPEGRTRSEEAIIAKVKAGVRAPSEKLRKAKAAGLLTPLEGKTHSQKERIMKGLAMEGLPLPEAKTASEKKIMEKVRADLGLPPEPKTSSMRHKYAKAADAGLLQPLEGKSPKEKERILQGLHDRGIPLPEGRTRLEEDLIAKVKAGVRAPSEKLRTAKAAGLLTPLEGKTHSQKERIMKGLAMEVLPLPEAKTASEKRIMEKVRADVGLPPEPKTSSIRAKYAEAADAGLIQPLEGKSPKEKERILQGLHDRGIPLPEGRTRSEEALVVKIKAGVREPSEKLRKLKAAGLLTPLEGKTHSQKERIMKGLAMEGMPLPEAKTASEKKIMERVRADLRLPPEPKTVSMREKYTEVADAGLMQPLEGKSPKEKERILQGLHDRGIPLPAGRTGSEEALIARVKAGIPAPSEKLRKADAGLLQPLEGKSPKEKERILQGLHDRGITLPEGRTRSEEALIARVKAGEQAPSVTPSERIRKAKAAGLLTPIEGKPPKQQEQILRGLAMQGLPLPEGQTSSEKKLIDKVRADLGLSPKPKTASMKEMYAKAADAGLLQPLEGKSLKDKERILQSLHERGIPLPEGRTLSEEALIARVKAGVRAPSEKLRKAKAAPLSITTEKLKKAKAAGLLTPLEGKTPEQKEKILKGLAESGLPLPQGKTVSEKAMIKKIKTELGVPERTPSQKIRKAKKTGLLTPLKDKTHSQKEKILRGRVAAGLPLPVGKTPSERALIQKIKADTGYVSPTTSERMKRAEDAGLLTPLEGKKPSAKEKILRDRVAAGIPLPEGRSPSEKELVRKIIAGEAPADKRPSEKLREAKTTSEKEKISKSLRKAGKLLPEGRTVSERELITKVKAERPTKVTSEKLQKAKEAGLLTPLGGKSPKEKERILRGLIEQGLPLPDSQTESEKEIAEKVRKEVGLPPEPITLSEKVKMHRAEAAGIVTPLEGKTPSMKERIVRGMVAAGIPLPEGRTSSEKAMIKNVQEEGKLSPKAAAGLLTPLEGKTPSQKDKIIRGRAEARIPLPEGKTASEKALVQQIRTEFGMPPLAKTVSEKEVVRKAKAEGLLTPIAGKSAREKERILKGLAKAGLPLPEGKTHSEKELVRKVRVEAGLPVEPTPSEKRGEIKTKSKKSGISPSKKRVKTMVAGISEKFEDIIKTRTCDRGCGCDKKKIRFKHSYVKIRVTSPDISSLCDCPDECLPGVKAGAFIDNEGIKVTVGRVNGVTSFTSQFSNHSLETPKNVITLYDKILIYDSYRSNTSIDTVNAPFDIKFESSDLKKYLFDACPLLRRPISFDKLNTDLDTSCTYTSDSYESYTNDKKNKIESDKSINFFECSKENNNDEFDRFEDSSRNTELSGDVCRSSSYSLHEFSVSYDSILVIKSEPSLSLNTISSDSMDVTGVKSLSNSSYYALSSTQYLYFPPSNGHFSDITVEETELFPKIVDYSENDASADDTMMSEIDNQVSVAHFNRAHTGNQNCGADCIRRKRNDTLSETKLHIEHNTQKISTRKTNNGEPVVVISNLDSEHDITTMVDQLLSKNEFSDDSSIFVVVPTSDDNDSDPSSNCSTICIQLSDHYPNRNQKQCNIEEPDIWSRRNSFTTRGLEISGKGKRYCMARMQEAVESFQENESIFHHTLPNSFSHEEKRKDKFRQISTPKQNVLMYHGVSTDTTSDRPCCCAPKIYGNHNLMPVCLANVFSELVTRSRVNQGLNCDEYHRLSKINVTQQASFVSINRAPMSVNPCAIPLCLGHPGCHHPSRMLQTPYCTPMPPPVPETAKPVCGSNQSQVTEAKPVSEQKQPESYQCCSDKLKEIFKQVLKGKAPHFKSTGCGVAADDAPTNHATISNKSLELDSSDSDDDEDCGD